MAEGKSSNDGREVIGIVSMGFKECAQGLPGYYTRVEKYTDWIVKEVERSYRRCTSCDKKSSTSEQLRQPRGSFQ